VSKLSTLAALAFILTALAIEVYASPVKPPQSAQAPALSGGPGTTRAVGSPADPSSQPPLATEAELWARFLSEYRREDYRAAADTLTHLAEISKGSGVPSFNLACVLCRLGEPAKAADALREALELGFVDFPRATRELAPGGELSCLTGTDVAFAIAKGAQELQQAVLDARLKRLRALAKGEPQSQIRDDDRRMVILSGHSPRALDDARVELERAEALWKAHIAPGLPMPAQPVPPAPDPWVIVWLPKADVFALWARREVGPGAATLGGLYRPHTHELVARDLGPTLRHEFWHALHHRFMSRAGQDHPLWLQEGLCALVEDTTWPASVAGTDPAPTLDELAASARFENNWRTNMARRMLDRGTLPKLSALIELSSDRFMDSGSLGRYAVSRSLMLYLHQTGKLQPFLQELVTAWPSEPTGLRALARATGQPDGVNPPNLAGLDRDFRAWLRKQPEAPEAGQPGTTSARLPFDVDERGGEGLTVLDMDAASMLKLGVAPGEVLVAVDARPVRDAHELAAALAGKKAGDRVELTLRKSRAQRTVKTTLIAERH
jgi:hypothetical protein